MNYPRVGIIGMGEMGAAIGGRLRKASFQVFTDGSGRSAATNARITYHGISSLNFEDLLSESDILLSIVPPGEAYATAAKVAESLRRGHRDLVFWDCNAASPDSKRRAAALFSDLHVDFIDGAIIGEPPTESFNPRFYAASSSLAALQKIAALHGPNALQIKVLEGKDVGAASALKSSYSGIGKGYMALLSAMVISASRNGALEALLEELQESRPADYHKIKALHRVLTPRVYRFGPEMENIANFAKSSGAEDMYLGMAKFFESLADAQRSESDENNWQELRNISESAGAVERDARW